MGIITLSRIYRPLYYNLISTKSGKIVAYAILPYFIFLYFGIGEKSSIYNLPYFYISAGTTNTVVNDFYDDKRGGDEITPCSIPSKMMESDGFLEVFIRYEPKSDDEALAYLCPNFDPNALTLENSQLEEMAQAKMNCLEKLVTIAIDDSVYQRVDYNFYEHPETRSFGLLGMIDAKHLNRGKHTLSIHRHTPSLDLEADTTYLIRQAVIPFWAK